MKIGIVTFHESRNFGAAMQAFALRRFLVNAGHEVIMINHRTKPKQLTEQQLNNFPYWDKFWLSYQNFFAQNFNLTQPYYNLKSLRKANFNIDLIIVGSDQVWSNSHSKLDPIYFADFVGDNVIRASFAASLGTTSLSYKGQALVFEKYLRDFDYISVREEKQSGELAKLVGKPVEVVLDPTQLLEKSEYMKFITERPFSSDYIYLHLHHPTANGEKLQNYGSSLSLFLGTPIVHNIPKTTFANQLGAVCDFSPDETVNTIFHSKFVITQSFHALSFCIIFQKPFGHILKGNATDERITHLLNGLGLSDRIITDASILPNLAAKQIDWASVSLRLWESKKKSIDYLYRVLSGVKQPRIKDWFSSNDPFTCYGCGACEATCPVNAIDLAPDDESFAYPVVNDAKCIKCGKCSRVCPYNGTKRESNFAAKAYLSFDNDEENRKNSSSGGMFLPLAKVILEQGGYVAGVKLSERFIAQYDIANDLESIKAFRYSKYVEPQHNDIFNKTLNALKGGNPVLFTGSPCKIAGLHNFLALNCEIDYDNLFTIDIICLASNAPKALETWLDAKAESVGSPLIDFQFRSPKAKSSEQAMYYRYENGKEEVVSKQDDLYMQCFLSEMLARKSCYCCQFTGHNKIADITIGDFWGSAAYYKGDVSKGVSAITINTVKGAELFEKIRPNIYAQEQKVWEVYSRNHAFPSPLPLARGAIFEKLQQVGVLKAFEWGLNIK